MFVPFLVTVFMVEYAVLADMVNPVSAVSTSPCLYCTSSGIWMHTHTIKEVIVLWLIHLHHLILYLCHMQHCCLYLWLVVYLWTAKKSKNAQNTLFIFLYSYSPQLYCDIYTNQRVDTSETCCCSVDNLTL